MADWPVLLAFVAATFAFAAVPGPAVLYVVTRTLAEGRRAGAASVLGMHLAGYVPVIATALGLSALLAAVPAVHTALKIAGGLYLIWLGFSMWRGAREPLKPVPPGRSLRQSAIVQLTNPKLAVFYLAFLPQFVDPAAAWPVAVQIATLGIVANLILGLSDLGYVLLASGLAARLTGQVATLRRIGGTVIAALGGAALIERA